MLDSRPIADNNTIKEQKFILRMRTNIDIDAGLIEQAQQLSGLLTKRAVVEEALRLMIQHYQQLQVRQLRGKLKWEGNLNEMRANRFNNAG